MNPTPKLKLTTGRDGIQLGDLTIQFMRTIRIPDDGNQHALPPGLGQFPVRRVEDYKNRVPKEWLKHGGVFLPMHEKEALWLNFSCDYYKPHALKVLMGMVNAITGKPYQEALNGDPQDYLVAPRQLWLDGIKTESDSIRQFVAMPLGGGYTVEGQITGEEKYGGLQLISYPAKKGKIKKPESMQRSRHLEGSSGMLFSKQCFGAQDEVYSMEMDCAMPAALCAEPDMGLGAGGQMRQEIYEDQYGVDTWDQAKPLRCYVHLCNAKQWQYITGEVSPALPAEVGSYYGPWYDVNDQHVPHVPGSEILDEVKSVETIEAEKGYPYSPHPHIIKYNHPDTIHDGEWPER